MSGWQKRTGSEDVYEQGGACNKINKSMRMGECNGWMGSENGARSTCTQHALDGRE